MATDPASPARGWYVVIGINRYRANPAVPNLRSAVSDACAVAELLRDKYGYQPLCEPLLDSAADRAGLINLLARLKHEDRPQDNLFFYFAGHGTAEDDPTNPNPIGYLVPHDAEDKEPNQANLLPMTDVRACLEQVSFKKVLAVLDCCHAGGIGLDATRDARRPRGIQFQEVYEEYHRQPTRQAISSATLSQKAKDSTRFGALGRRGEEDHSPFAAALLDVLRAEDAEAWQWGVLTANELMYHINRRMREKNQSQIPGLWTLDGNQVDYLFEPLGLSSHLSAEPDHNPYRGLLPYEVQDCDLFFGREIESADLQEKITQNHFVALVGRSGVGKSSLLRAGLIADLLGPAGRDAPLQKEDRPVRRAAYLPVAGVETWAALLLRPQAAPLAGLAEALGRLLGRAVAANELGADASALKWADDFAAAHPGRLLLAVDQLEELILECRDERERVQFLNLLGRALEEKPGVIHIAIAYRTDYQKPLKDLVGQTALAPFWNQHAPYELREMNAQGLREVVEQPVRQRHLRFEAEGTKRLEDQLLEDVKGEPGALPLLSFTLSRLYEEWARKWRGDHLTDRILTFASYETLGGAVGALGKRADEVYEALKREDPGYRRTAPNVMLRMVQISGEGGVRPVPEDELIYPDDAETKRAWTFVNDMEAANLLVVGNKPNRKVEPAHSALMQRWDRLRQWRDEEDAVSYLPLQRELAEAARKPPAERALWDKHPKLPQLSEELWRTTPGRILWPGPIAAIRSLPPPGPASWLSKKEVEFIQESMRVRARSQLFGLLSLAIFVIGLSAAMVVAWVQKGAAVEAKATAVAAATRADEQRRLAVTSAAEEARQRSTAVAATTAEATARIFADQKRIAAETAAAAEAQAKATAESRRVDAEREAKLALSRELAARSALELAARRYETSLLLAIQSAQTAETTQAFDAMRRILRQPGRTQAIEAIKPVDCRTKLGFEGQPGEVITFPALDGLTLTDPDTGDEFGILRYPFDSFLVRAFRSPDGKRVLTVDFEGNALIWNLQTGKYIQLDHSRPLRTYTNQQGQVITLEDDFVAVFFDDSTLEGPLLGAAWDPTGKRVVTTGCSNLGSSDVFCGRGGAWVWDSDTGEPLVSLIGHSDWVCEPQWLADETHLRTVSSDGTEREWAVEGGSELPSISPQEGEAQAVPAAMPACGLSEIQIGAALDQTPAALSSAKSLICVEDKLWVTSRDGALLLDGLTPGVLADSLGEPVFDAQIDPKGRSIALARCRRRWDIGSTSVVFCDKGMVEVRDALTGELTVELPTSGTKATLVSWSEDMGHLLYASDDDEDELLRMKNPRLTVVDAGSWRERFSVSGLSTAPYRIAWTARGDRFLAFDDKVTHQYFLLIGDLIRAACALAPRNFTWDEWNQLMTGSYHPTCPGRLIPETAVQGMRDAAAKEIQSGQIESARQRLNEMNTWLTQSRQADTLGVEVEQFVNQTLKR